MYMQQGAWHTHRLPCAAITVLLHLEVPECGAQVDMSPHEPSNRAIGPDEWTPEKHVRRAGINCSPCRGSHRQLSA